MIDVLALISKSISIWIFQHNQRRVQSILQYHYFKIGVTKHIYINTEFFKLFFENYFFDEFFLKNEYYLVINYIQIHPIYLDLKNILKIKYI